MKKKRLAKYSLKSARHQPGHYNKYTSVLGQSIWHKRMLYMKQSCYETHTPVNRRLIIFSLLLTCFWIELRLFGVFFGFVFVICGWNSLTSFVCGDRIHFKRLLFSCCTFITFLWSCLDMSPVKGAEKVETVIFIPLRKTPAFHLLGSETFAGLQ